MRLQRRKPTLFTKIIGEIEHDGSCLKKGVEIARPRKSAEIRDGTAYQCITGVHKSSEVLLSGDAYRSLTILLLLKRASHQRRSDESCH